MSGGWECATHLGIPAGIKSKSTSEYAVSKILSLQVSYSSACRLRLRKGSEKQKSNPNPVIKLFL